MNHEKVSGKFLEALYCELEVKMKCDELEMEIWDLTRRDACQWAYD